MFSRLYHVFFIVNLSSFCRSTRFVKNETFGLIKLTLTFQSEEYFAFSRISSCFCIPSFVLESKTMSSAQNRHQSFRVICTVGKVRTKIIYLNVENEWTWGVSLFNS